jgi:formylglycine-generating enzyme required for sulfatase activity
VDFNVSNECPGLYDVHGEVWKMYTDYEKRVKVEKPSNTWIVGENSRVRKLETLHVVQRCNKQNQTKKI